MGQKVDFDIFEVMEDVDDTQPLTEQDLGAIGKLAQRQWELERPARATNVKRLEQFIKEQGCCVAEVEAALKEIKGRLNYVKQTTLPEILLSKGLESFTIADGTTFEVKRDVTCSVPEPNRIAFNDWMIRKGWQSLIKNQCAVVFPKGGRKSSKRFRKYVERYYAKKGTCTITEKEAIHAQTLKAHVKRELEKGTKFPEELIKIHEYHYTKIKKGR